MDDIIDFDKQLFKMINNDLSSRFFDWPMVILSNNLFYATIVCALLVYAVRKNQRRLLLALCLAALCAGIADMLSFEWLKPFFARYRPCYEARQLVRTVAGCAGSYGFPSNHAANSMAVAATLALTAGWRWGALGFSLAAMIGYSRIYLGVHYPLDILGGFVFGGIVALTFYMISKPLQSQVLQHGFTTKN